MTVNVLKKAEDATDLVAEYAEKLEIARQNLITTNDYLYLAYEEARQAYNDALEDAKEKVRAAGTSVGGFKFTPTVSRSISIPVLLRTVGKYNMGLDELRKVGVVEIKVKKKVFKNFRRDNPELDEALKSAKGLEVESPGTARISSPKEVESL